jgi:PleD family two-component response regulator
LQQVLAKLMIPHSYSPASKYVSVSMGLAWCEPENDSRPDQLVAAADEALYSAKEFGRNGFSDVVIVENQPIFQLS